MIREVTSILEAHGRGVPGAAILRRGNHLLMQNAAGTFMIYARSRGPANDSRGCGAVCATTAFVLSNAGVPAPLVALWNAGTRDEDENDPPDTPPT
jgi:hypothetical protein